MGYKLNLTDRAAKVGLDPALAHSCTTDAEQDMMLIIQALSNDYAYPYGYACECAPKDATKEYNAVMKDLKRVGKYLFKTHQYEALAALDEVRIYKEQPRVKAIKTEYRAEAREIINAVVKTTRKRDLMLSAATVHLEFNETVYDNKSKSPN